MSTCTPLAMRRHEAFEMNETKKQVTETPNRDDVHEQREPNQPREGVVEKPEKPAVPHEPGKASPSRPDR